MIVFALLNVLSQYPSHRWYTTLPPGLPDGRYGPAPTGFSARSVLLNAAGLVIIPGRPPASTSRTVGSGCFSRTTTCVGSGASTLVIDVIKLADVDVLARSRFAFAAVALNGAPSWNVTPVRSSKLMLRPSGATWYDFA